MRSGKVSLLRRANWNSRSRVLITLLLASMLLIAGMAPAAVEEQATASARSVANVQPALQALAIRNPDAVVRVIVQARVEGDALSEVVTALGGTIIRDLSIIRAVAVEIEAEAAWQLGIPPGGALGESRCACRQRRKRQ